MQTGDPGRILARPLAVGPRAPSVAPAIGARSPQAAAAPLRIALLAPELTHGHGGMPEMARELGRALHATATCTVYGRDGEPVPGLPFAQRPILARDLAITARRLAAEPVPDVYLALNASHAALAPRLRAPLVVYCNGNDVLNPWLTFPRPALDRLARLRAGLWRLEPALRRRLRDRDMRRGFARAARILVNSRSTEALVARAQPGHAARTVVVPPGVGERFFGVRHRPAPDDTLRLLTVSRLERWTLRKNVDGVIAALALLPPALRVRYTVIGDGDDRPRLQALAQERGLGDRVHFAGAVDDAALLDAYATTDIFVMASKAGPNDVEGFGIVYMEASAAGVPVICSRAGGAVDAVTDGENGILIDGAEPPDIAEGIVRLAALRPALPPARVRAVAEPYRWPRIAERFRAECAVAAAASGEHD